MSSNVLSVGGTARANESALRYAVEFSVQSGDGPTAVPRQTIERLRELRFDATQALGIAFETDLLGKERAFDMVQMILRRLEAFGKATESQLH